jgi:hypothetical protein
MNAKRLVLACFSVFLLVFAYDFLLHSIILKTDYVVTGFLWRSPEQMQSYFGSLLFGQVQLSVAFCLIYAFLSDARASVCEALPVGRGGPAAPLRRGVIYGLLAGLLLCGPNFITFAVQPFPLDLIVKWTLGRLIQMSLAGLLLGAIYRPGILREAPVQAMAA